jgi:hypothetical protein
MPPKVKVIKPKSKDISGTLELLANIFLEPEKQAKYYIEKIINIKATLDKTKSLLNELFNTDDKSRDHIPVDKAKLVNIDFFKKTENKEAIAIINNHLTKKTPINDLQKTVLKNTYYSLKSYTNYYMFYIFTNALENVYNNYNKKIVNIGNIKYYSAKVVDIKHNADPSSLSLPTIGKSTPFFSYSIENAAVLNKDKTLSLIKELLEHKDKITTIIATPDTDQNDACSMFDRFVKKINEINASKTSTPVLTKEGNKELKEVLQNFGKLVSADIGKFYKIYAFGFDKTSFLLSFIKFLVGKIEENKGTLVGGNNIDTLEATLTKSLDNFVKSTSGMIKVNNGEASKYTSLINSILNNKDETIKTFATLMEL